MPKNNNKNMRIFRQGSGFIFLGSIGLLAGISRNQGNFRLGCLHVNWDHTWGYCLIDIGILCVFVYG